MKKPNKLLSRACTLRTSAFALRMYPILADPLPVGADVLYGFPKTYCSSTRIKVRLYRTTVRYLDSSSTRTKVLQKTPSRQEG